MGLPIMAMTITLLLLATSVHGYPYYRQNSKEVSSISEDLDSLNNWFGVNSIFTLGNPDGKPNYELDNQNDLQINELYEDTDESSEEPEEYIEDDIIISLSKQRNGVRSKSDKWPGGIIPYKISSKFDAGDRKLIKEAMDSFHKNTCIRFKLYTDNVPWEVDYVRIRPTERGCSSIVGRNGGLQNLNLSPVCSKKKGSIIHELMHAVGFHHEQCRSDRDDYVEIKWDNIKDDEGKNFKKYDVKEVDDFGVSYDYDSVMHYSSIAHSRNGKPTIVVKGDKNVKIGQRDGLSVKDIQKIRKMYNCR